MYFLDPLDRLRLQRSTERLHRLGARATAEAFATIGHRLDAIPVVMAVLHEFELCPAEVLRYFDGDKFGPGPFREVPK